jgi:hypothetical protein
MSKMFWMRPRLELARAGLVKEEPKRSANPSAEAGRTGRQRQLKPPGPATGEKERPPGKEAVDESQ